MNTTGKSQFAPSFSGKNKRKFWLRPLLVVVAILVIVGGFFAWKTGFILSKISTDGSGGLFQSLARAIPGADTSLKGEKEGRINVLLLGMRGADLPGGGTLADTIMVASIEPKENRIALVSIPRDLYVQVPGSSQFSKINAVHAYGEENGAKQGLSQMEKIASEVSGLPIDYAVSIDFKGFKELVDSLGGINIYLDNSFSEPLQFLGGMGRCDGINFVIPSGKDEAKTWTRKNGSIATQHFPLCYTKASSSAECGGNFKLDAGNVTLTGDQALCFVRSRETSSDFERAKRQQIILQKIQEKATSLGTLSDFSKLNGMLDALGNNVRTDMQAWEMKRFYDIYKGMQSPQIFQRVLENTPEGLLYNPTETPETGYILKPIGDNYDQIRQMFQNIFTMPAQTDIQPKM